MANTIRNKMYTAYPEEGVWYCMAVEVLDDEKGRVHFEYDRPLRRYKNYLDPCAAFSDDLETYLRSKEFTPSWLTELLRTKRLPEVLCELGGEGPKYAHGNGH